MSITLSPIGAQSKASPRAKRRRKNGGTTQCRPAILIKLEAIRTQRMRIGNQSYLAASLAASAAPSAASTALSAAPSAALAASAAPSAAFSAPSAPAAAASAAPSAASAAMASPSASAAAVASSAPASTVSVASPSAVSVLPPQADRARAAADRAAKVTIFFIGFAFQKNVCPIDPHALFRFAYTLGRLANTALKYRTQPRIADSGSKSQNCHRFGGQGWARAARFLAP